MNLPNKQEELKTERDTFIMNLGKEKLGDNGGGELQQRNIGKCIYDTLKFPGNKEHKFHLVDKNELLKRSSERSIDLLENDSVAKILKFFVENTENIMDPKRDEYKFTSEDKLGEINEDNNVEYQLEHESQINRELATANKKRYVESLLLSLIYRRSVEGPGEKMILITESLYALLDRLSTSSNEEKLQLLDSLCDFLPDHSWDLWPNSDEMEWIFEHHVM